MKIVNFVQGSPLWLEWRKSKITATSAAILMGNNPWKAPLDLFNEMLGITPPQETNAAMARGSELEPIARALFIEETGIIMEPICCEHSDYSWMACSLDGWNADNNAILEIKCPNEKSHIMACEGHVPIYYADQVQHQIACTGASICYYFSYRPEFPIQHAIIEIKPDLPYIQRIMEAERTFYEDNLCCFNPPSGPELLKLRK